MKLVVISGLSGAGKSTAMHALEDLGYYCVDNLPMQLLPALAESLAGDPDRALEHVAVVVDARNPRTGFDLFPDLLEPIRDQGVTCVVLFLEAGDHILLKRFSETRRKHPLTAADVPLGEALRRERVLLEPVRRCADICIDTTTTHLHQLRDLIRQRVAERPLDSLSLLFQSFGYKHGMPPDADMVFDVRCLPNPHWEPNLRNLSGKDEAVARFLDAEPKVRSMVENLTTFLERWVPEFEAENRAYLTVAIGCTGGHHRSVYIVETLAAHFRGRRDGVIVRHREVD